MEILLNIVVCCIVFANIHGTINEDLPECNAVYINSNEFERMNLKEQEEYVRRIPRDKTRIRSDFFSLGTIDSE